MNIGDIFLLDMNYESLMECYERYDINPNILVDEETYNLYFYNKLVRVYSVKHQIGSYGFQSSMEAASDETSYLVYIPDQIKFDIITDKKTISKILAEEFKSLNAAKISIEEKKQSEKETNTQYKDRRDNMFDQILLTAINVAGNYKDDDGFINVHQCKDAIKTMVELGMKTFDEHYGIKI